MSGWSKVAAAVTVGFGVAMGGGLAMAAEISVLSSNGLKEVLLEAMDDAAKAGKLAAGSRVTLARTGVAVAVRAGAPKPDIGSADAFRKSLLAAKSFAHSRGASGVHMAHVIERLGISEQMKPKTVIVDNGPVGAVVAKGEAEMGVQLMSELLPVAGIDIVGPLPAALQKMTVLVGGVYSGAREPAAAQALLKFLSADAALPVIRKKGME
ncbi:MAG TPA: substrate-binding domain-containing protein [Burkholderiales bacterium]|nr:substrate-binding domain-containing protein [Burkholderiales bacterium]